MVAEGLKAGVPDVFLDVPRKGFHGLRIELKTPRIPAIKGVRLSKAAGSTTELQDEWLAHYRLHGYAAHVAYGWDDAMQIIKDYLAA
jgi:hypothetical protein